MMDGGTAVAPNKGANPSNKGVVGAGAPGAGSLSSAHMVGVIGGTSLVDRNEAFLLLEDAMKQEQSLDHDISQIMTQAHLFQPDLLQFHALLPEKLHPIFKEAQDLLTTINNTCSLAESVSRKVRDLDTIRARVRETAKKVEDIIDLKNCADIVKKAMAAENYETAAEHIQKYMGFTNKMGTTTDETGSYDVSGGNLTHDLISNAEQQLKTLIRSKLEQSLTHDKQDEIIRFCKLYATLGMKDEGLTRYCHYLRKLCSNSAEQTLKQYLYSTGRLTTAPVSNELLTAAAALTKVFEFVAETIEAQVSVVEEHFGSGSAVTMIRNMVEQSNTHTSRIVELFMENHAVSRKLDFTADKARIPEKDRDPSVLTPTLNEMVSICKSAEFYSRFITKKILNLPAVAATTTKKSTNAEVAASINSELARKVQEIISNYISLEEYFMVESVQKAIKMDEHSGDSLTSSMVDYVFFVLQQSTQRAVESHNIYGVCATLNHVLKCLDSYKEILIRFFKDQLAKAPTIVRAGDKNIHLVALNNLEVSSEYILKIKSEIESKTDRMFTRPEDKEKSKTALGDLLEISKRFKQALELSMEQFCFSLQSRTRPLFDLFANVNYEITDQEYANNEINDPFAQVFIAEGGNILLKPFSACFTPTNYDLFIHQIVAFITKKLEKLLLQKRMNQLGALQFDKDLLTISSYFSSTTTTIRSVRDKFARLSQMATLLTSESLSEVSEIWGENSGNITWRLTPTEVRKVLMLRVDYPPEQIARLKL